jgi:DNA-binding response OmpR family regulator
MTDRIALVVDDEPSIRRYLSMILQQEDFRSIEAEDGAHALQIMQEHGESVGLIVSDVQMPHCDGISFAQAVKKAYPEIPIILVSGRGQPTEKFDGFVEKPFHAGELLEAVRIAVARKAAYVLG